MQGEAIVDWILVGYIAKRRILSTGWVSAWPDSSGIGDSCSAAVEEICSVSHCIAKGVRNAQDPLDLHHSPDSAWAAVPIESQADHELYAYYLWPIQFDEGIAEPIDLWWEPEVMPLAESFERLGWDVVRGGNGYSFGCSPMSCNQGCRVVHCPDMNRFCLVSNFSAALELARRFSIDKPEPGPYCVVDVWRASRTANSFSLRRS